MRICCFIFCSALFAGVIQAAEKPDARANQPPGGKTWSLPTLKPDPSLRDAIQKALLRSNQLLRDTSDKTLVQAMLQIDDPPADLAFDVSLRSGDRAWRVGPMAWKKGDIKWWAYDVDLPVSVTHVDIIFSPSARAGMIMSRFPVYPIKGLNSIWSGEPIIVPKVEIRNQDISMIKQRPPCDQEAREHLIDTLPPDCDQVRQLSKGMSLGEIRKQLDEQTAKENPAREALFSLGCVMVAQGQLDEAMTTLSKARGVAALDEQLQHELRFICARWFDAADNGGLPEMFFLGRAYEEGNGVGQDAQQAKYWYRKAANAGYAEATARLACMKPLFPNIADSVVKTLAVYRAQAAEWHVKSTTTYQEWVEHNAQKAFQAENMDGKAADLKVVITIIQGEVEGEAAHDIRSSQTRYETELFADGRSRSFRYNSRGSSGGEGGTPLPANQLARIDQLLARLPDDHGILPPVSRRLLIETANQPERHVRVYDLANAPPDICELMRLLPTGIAYVPRFQASGSVHVGGYEYDGALAVSPQNEILYTGRRDRLQWWDPATREFIAEMEAHHVKDIVFAPDKIHALVQSSTDIVLIDLPERKPIRIFKDRFNAQFTRDGRHVLLHGNNPPMQILVTQSWEPTNHTDDVPNDCTGYIPAPSIDRALVRAADGSVTLWDTGAHRPVKKLDSGSDVTMIAAFSPDESRIALCVHPWLQDRGDGVPIVIYNSHTGATELCPLETGGSIANVRSLLWTPDGAYVLATEGESGISVFNATTGKCRGQLLGPVRINGMGLLARSGELVAGDEYGKIWFWDLSAVMDNVREFEASLTAPEKPEK